MSRAGSVGPGGRFTVEGEATVFGFPPTPAALSVRRRPRSWRVGGAARTMVISAAIAPFAALVPPHAPWAIGALGTGMLLARRRLQERFTLERVEGTCPKCGVPLVVKAARLRRPHPVSCDSCHHQTALRFPAQSLEGGSTEGGA